MCSRANDDMISSRYLNWKKEGGGAEFEEVLDTLKAGDVFVLARDNSTTTTIDKAKERKARVRVKMLLDLLGFTSMLIVARRHDSPIINTGQPIDRP